MQADIAPVANVDIDAALRRDVCVYVFACFFILAYRHFRYFTFKILVVFMQCWTPMITVCIPS